MRILFQGDSVTDAGRDRSDPHNLGPGYPFFSAEGVRSQFPELDLEFLNLGISGNRTSDLLARWQEDCIDLQPDVFSILIGINDTWRRFDENKPTLAGEFETNYRRLLEAVRTKTQAKILMLEPFLLSVDPVKETWRFDLDEKIQIIRKLSREYADVYIPLDGLFAAHCVDHEPSYWSDDGVHPNENGARLIAEYYIKAFSKIK